MWEIGPIPCQMTEFDDRVSIGPERLERHWEASFGGRVGLHRFLSRPAVQVEFNMITIR